MRFFRRHLGVHIWLLACLALLGVYLYGAGSAARADAVCAVTGRIRDALAAFFYLLPFSAAEWLYALFILTALAWVPWFVLRVRRSARRPDAVYGGALGLVCLLLTAASLYCVLWGVNYYASGFQEKSGVRAQPAATEELTRVTELFAGRLSELSDRIPRDGDGLFAAGEDDIFAGSVRVYDSLSEEFPFLEREDRVPKRMFFSRLFSAMNFTGFYCPYTGESNLNVDSPRCLLPANIAHELAHQRGIASEQECNFLAIAAAVSCGDPVYQYSGYLMGYIHLSNALYRADRAAWEAVRDTLPDGVLADLSYHSAYWAQFRGRTAEVSRSVYDAALKSYGQEDGIASYGTCVDLLTAYY